MMHLVELAVGAAFAFFVPPFFIAVARMNASLGYPDLEAFLPKIFKFGFWFGAGASCMAAVAVPFLEEGRAEAAISICTGLLLAWRFRYALKKVAIQLPETTRGK